jgi:uncharacterized RDD family membrane protein YckC
VKCPKCSYLGFETGDRCRNCGYDFSLLTEESVAAAATDLELREDGGAADSADWLARFETQYPLSSSSPDPLPRDHRSRDAVPAPASRPAARARRDSKLPLFSPGSGDSGDAPLVKLPAAPRAPLAVRRTPDVPRLRAVPKPVPQPVPEPSLGFEEESGSTAVLRKPPESGLQAFASESVQTSGVVRRTGAALLDAAILGGVDLAVVYLTVRMTSLSLGDWTALPLPPLLAFLALVKLAYFVAFTSVGGQTIGKMATGIRVVAADGAPVTPVVALRRTLASAVSAAILGLGYASAFFDPQQRTLHDRVAHTRVIVAA